MARELSQAALAAKQIKAGLKKMGIQATVKSSTYANGDAVNVNVQNLTPDIYADAANYVNQFQAGHFDSMRDIYEYNNKRYDIHQAKFVFLSNNFTSEVKQKAWDYLRNSFSYLQNAPKNHNEAARLRFGLDGSDCDQLICRALRGVFGQFWSKGESK
jgi:hypothetical protein